MTKNILWKKPTDKSYFPIRVRYTETGEKEVVHSPEKLRPGRDFQVIETNVRIDSR